MASAWTAPPPPLEQHRRAWQDFLDDPDADVSALVRRHVGELRRVVDAGCGGGQELSPYLGAAVCIGVDLSPHPLGLARQQFRARAPDAPVALVRADVEALPLAAGSVDVVICRLVLPYTDNRRALREMARVLRRGGGVVLVFHHYRYYLGKLAAGVRARDLRPVVYALRVLFTGAGFHLSGTQRSILGMRETYITRSHLRRLAAAEGLDLVGSLPGGSAAAPRLLFRRA